jgi:V/A-type H+-transporting ATPase subunit K
MKKLNRRVTISVLAALTTSIALAGLMGIEQAFAQGEEASAGSSKLLGAGLAFGLAAAGAGIGLGFVGAAGLAAISDNPKMQSRVFIFVGMVESIAIYGIVMMFIILGQ